MRFYISKLDSDNVISSIRSIPFSMRHIVEVTVNSLGNSVPRISFQPVAPLIALEVNIYN